LNYCPWTSFHDYLIGRQPWLQGPGVELLSVLERSDLLSRRDGEEVTFRIGSRRVVHQVQLHLGVLDREEAFVL
jgi:hypothetical protein